MEYLHRPQINHLYQHDAVYPTKSLRSSTDPYIKKKLCIICNKSKISENTHKVKKTKKGLIMILEAKKIEDKSFFIRLNTITNSEDDLANDVIYHHQCWVYKLCEASKDERTFDKTHNDTVANKIRYRNH